MAQVAQQTPEPPRVVGNDVPQRLAEVEKHQAVTQERLEHLSSKEALADFRTEVKTEFANVRTELADFKTEVKTEFANVRAEFANVRAEIANIYTAIANAKTSAIVWSIGAMIALSGIIIGAVFTMLKMLLPAS